MQRLISRGIASKPLLRSFTSSSALRSGSAPDYYRTLNVKKTATPEEIKSAFHELAKLHHPDVQGASTSAAETFKAVNEAYSVLSDSAEKAVYDASISTRDPTEALRRRNEGPGMAGPRDIGLDPTFAGYTAAQRATPRSEKEQAEYDLAVQVGSRAGAQPRGPSQTVSPPPSCSGPRSEHRRGQRYGQGRRWGRPPPFRPHMSSPSTLALGPLLQRANRARVDVPTHSATLWKLAYPLAIIGLWAFNYVVFVQPASPHASHVN